MDELEYIASNPSNAIQVSEFRGLFQITSIILIALCPSIGIGSPDAGLGSHRTDHGSSGTAHDSVKTSPAAIDVFPSSCSMKLDLIIILDSSGSVEIKNWPHEIDFAKRLVNRFHVSKEKTHIGVIDFSTESIIRVDLNKPEGASKELIQERLDQLKTEFQSGITYIDFALKTAIKMYDEVPANRKAPKMLIILTDGKATQRNGQSGFELMKEPILSLKSSMVNMIAVGVGKFANLDELKYIASNPRNVIQISEFKVLLQKNSTIFDDLCQSTDPVVM